MDLSGIIFVVLAVGWAVYLLPKALKRHDDADLSRPVEEFSDKVRVLGRGFVARVTEPAAATPDVTTPDVATPDVELVETPGHTRRPVSTVTREAARAAARRRRRVLGLLLTILVAVSVTSYLGYTPWYTTAIPGALVVAFLVVARLTVRAQQLRGVAPVQQSRSAVAAQAAPAPAPDAHAPDVALRDGAGAPPQEPLVETPAAFAPEDLEPDLGTEDTQGLSRDELADAVVAPVLDEGGLWDPLPVTLPTYVSKPRARRTVRTVEITAGSAGITSSGHDAADSALAAEAAAAEKETAVEESAETPKAAGA